MSTAGLSWHRKPRRQSWGHAEGQRIRGAVGFSPAVFEQISTMAWRNRLSFQEQVRRLVETGLKTREVEP